MSTVLHKATLEEENAYRKRERIQEITAEQFATLKAQAGSSGKQVESTQTAESDAEEVGDDKAQTVNDVDLNELERKYQIQGKLLKRIANLKAFYEKNLLASEVKNGGFEVGRPAAQLSDALKGSMDDVFTRPTLDALLVHNTASESNAVATAEDLAAISALLSGLGWPSEHMAPLFWSIARYCANVGSSAFVDPDGSFEIKGVAMTRDQILAAVKEVTTLRKFCRAFAPVVWNMMLVNKDPPTNWQAQGYTEETKYAAFDTFDYVTCRSSVKPLGGLLRQPTMAEKMANHTSKKLKLDSNARNDRFLNTNAEITGGMQGCVVKTKLGSPSCTG